MISIKYTLFAIISILLNILFQSFSFLVHDGFASLYVAMFVGTLAGLTSKYILDKNFIFYYKSKNKIHDVKKFLFYTLTGGFTTFIFWGTEIGFDVIVGGAKARYLGAIIGLSIGYIFKYFLDKKYVFKVQTI